MSATNYFSQDDDLDKVWERVVDKFIETAGLDKHQMKDRSTVEVNDALKGLMGVDSHTKQKAQIAVDRILSCVQSIGGTVAAATCAIFAPSQPCFNALNLAIVAIQGYKKMFEDLALLLERLSVFLETLNIYLKDERMEVVLDKRLRSTVYRVLEQYMHIMALTIKLCKQGFKGKIKAYAKNLFKDDSGVTEALAIFETRIAEVARVQIAVIGQDLSVAAKDIRILKGDVKAMLKNDENILDTLGKLEQRAEAQEHDEILRSCLRLTDASINLPWNRHAKLAEDRVSDTGSWLVKDHTEFLNWSTVGSESTPIILLTGGVGHGKTFLASSVVDHLRWSEDLDFLFGSYATAFYYVQDKAAAGSSSSQMRDILQSMVWQLAKQHSEYRNFLVDQCQRKDLSMDKTQDLWKNLICSYKPKL